MNTIDIIGNKCVGCRSCEQICPTRAINMVENNEGFIYPKINYNKCINCGKCLTHCAQFDETIKANLPIKVYAVKSKNKKRINKSTSGGVCDVISQYIIENNGCVFGAVYDKDLKVIHKCVKDSQELYKLQSSKYLLSDTLETYQEVKGYLNAGSIVLYTGTPCQIEGLYKFLNKDYKNLYTISLICHGCPSYKAFRKYLDYKEKKLRDKITYYNFRSKKAGWGYNIEIQTKKGKYYYSPLNLDIYGKDFLNAVNYRESCYICKYAKPNRVGDISVGDYWGIIQEHPEFYSDRGVSIVIVNTKKGLKLLEKLSNIDIIESSFDNIVKHQVNLKHPTPRPLERGEYYLNIDDDNFFDDKKIKLSIRQKINKLIPISMKRIIKHIVIKIKN